MKNIIRVLYLISTLSLSGIIYSQQFPDLTIVTEKWKPYHYIENSELKGIVIDLMSLIFKDLNSKQDITDIKLYPWARAYRDSLNIKNTLIFSMTRTDEREDLFKWVGPIFEINTYLISKKNRDINLNDISTINDYKIGTIIDDVGEYYIQQLGLGVNIEKRASKFQYLLELLDKDRIDIVVSNWSTFINDAKLIGIDPEQYEAIYLVDKSELFFAFNKDTPDYIVSKFEESFNRIKSLDEYQDIFTNYKDYFYE